VQAEHEQVEADKKAAAKRNTVKNTAPKPRKRVRLLVDSTTHKDVSEAGLVTVTAGSGSRDKEDHIQLEGPNT
jgi:hypothetical protein